MDPKIPDYAKSVHALVLSPSPDIRTNIKKKLSSLGVKDVHSFDQTQDAYDHCMDHEIDLIITEWSVQTECDGLTLINRMRKEPKLFNTSCVVITPYVDQDHIVQAAFYDVDEYIAKPFSGKTLEEAYWRALKKRKDPSPFTRLMRAAVESLVNRRFHEAYEQFKTALDERPQAAAPRFYLGFIELIFGNFEKGIEFFDEGVAMQPNHLKCQLGKAFILKKMNKVEDFYETLKIILEIFPAHPNAVHELIPLAVERHEYDFAYQILKHMLEVRSEFPRLDATIELYGLTVVVKYVKERGAGAIKEILPALRSFRVGREKFSTGLVTLMRNVGLSLEADAETARVSAEFGNSFDLAYNQALVYFHARNYQKCVESCVKMQDHFGPHEQSMQLLMKCYERMRNFAKAKQVRAQMQTLRKGNSPTVKEKQRKSA